MTKTRIIYDKERQRAGREIHIDLNGGGGELGIRNMKLLVDMINNIKEQKTPEDVHSAAQRIIGYALCCVNSGFLSEESALELADMLVLIAGEEAARAAAEQRKAPK